ncbi:MAG TPA: hypothetical protein VMC08_00785 [Bacteroidales bacterium]|nr:hypothetical protein [Bacteroidales bacterium]
MKIRKFTRLLVFAGAIALLATSCSPITMTTWKNPKEDHKITNLVVWGMFDKMENQKPFEQAMAGYFNKRGLKTIEGLSFLNPMKDYKLPELEKKFDSLGADGILIVSYTGTDKSESYVPMTTVGYPDYYYDYYGYYSWGYPMWGPGYGTSVSGGYWSTNTVVHLRANLYDNADNKLLWTADISIDNPEYVDQVSYALAEKIYTDWAYNKLMHKSGK